MRKSIFFAGLATIAAISFSSCSKNEVDTPETPTTFTHTVTIKAEVPKTRTAIVEGTDQATFKWSSDDAGRFYLTEAGVAGTGISIDSEDNYQTITLSATFSHDETPTSYVYAGFLSKNKTGTPFPKIPASQISTASSYDPNADILVAKPQTFDVAQDELTMQFARPVVINKMTIKGLDEGESISSIVVSADKKIVGYYKTDSDAWEGQTSEITISTDQTVPSSGKVTVYFVSMPVEEATLSLTITTGNYSYSKTFSKTINFVPGEVTVFSVSSLTKTQKANYSGTYVLTNASGTKMADAWSNGNNLPAKNVTSEDGTIYYDPDEVNINAAKIVVAKITDTTSPYYGMYTMVQNGLYLYAASSGANHLNGEEEADENAYWEISNSNDVWSIVAAKSSNRNVLQNTENVFSCYQSANQTQVALHSSFAPTPVINAPSSISLTSDAITVSTSTGASFNSNSTTVTAGAYSDEDCTVSTDWLAVTATGSGTNALVNYTANANSGEERTAYIKITATNSSSRSVTKMISVTQASEGQVYETWTKIDKIENLVAGDYIMCAVVGDNYHAWTGSFSSGNCVTESIIYDSNKELTYTNATTVTLISSGEANQYYVKWISGQYTDYLASSSNTKLKYVTEMSEIWTASNASTGILLKGSVNNGYIRSATGASSNYIRSYSSTGNVGVVFFKKD